MTEILFYHLQRQPMEAVLPGLLEKCLERGWKAVVQCGSEERLEALDSHLWTYADESFLPHGTAREGPLDGQPIALVTSEANPNGATVRFLVDGAAPGGTDGLTRLVLLFDGENEDQLAAAREHWKRLKAGGHAPTYWQQDERGRWEKKA